MKLFWRVFAAVFVSIVITTLVVAFISASYQISRGKREMGEEYKFLCRFLAKEIEKGYLQSMWPFETLRRVNDREGFLFWWIVRDDGVIYLADNTTSVGTNAYARFAELAHPPEGKESILFPRQDLAICVEPITIEEKRWSFVLGASTKRLSSERNRTIAGAAAFSVSTLLLLGTALYFMIRGRMKPIDSLVAGAAIIGQGDLAYRVKVTSRDELGSLAESFNKMVGSLQKTTVSKDYVDSIITSMNEALIVVDQDARIKKVNERACDLLGYQEDELLDQPVGKIFASLEDIPFGGGKAPELRGNVVESINLETAFRTKDGNEIPILLGSSTIKEASGEAEWIVFTATDITERRRMEKILRESEERFRVGAESASDLIWEWDILRGRLEWFGDIDGMLGYVPGEFPRTIEAWERIIHPEDHDRVMTALERHLKTREPYHEEYRVERKDGTYWFWADRGKALWDEKGNPLKMVGACADITERKLAEEAIRESEARYRAVIEQSPDGIYLVDAEKRCILEANPAFAQLLGYTLEEMPGLSIFEFVAADREQVEERFQEILKGEAPLVYERQFRKKDGSLVDAWVSSTAISYWGKKAACTIVRDLTERKRSEREREELIHELQEALANVKTLRGLVPICANCKKIRDDKGYWQQVETYVRDHSEAIFSHGLCPECIKDLFPNTTVPTLIE